MATSLYTSELQDLIKHYKHRREAWEDIFASHEFRDLCKPIIEKYKYYDSFVDHHYEQDLKLLKERFHKDESSIKFYWIGINPCETMKDLSKEKVKNIYRIFRDKIHKTPWMRTCAWTVEAHTAEGYRPHIHFLLADTSVRQSRVIDTLARLFKCAKNMIDVKTFNYDFNKKLNYIKGIKKEEKQHLVKLDNEMKIELDIPLFIDSL